MIDKEISEIRRRISPEKNNIEIIRGRYINANRETICEFKSSFGLLTEDVIEKYLGVLRRVLSGTNGRNLVDIGFSMGQVEHGEEHADLQLLRKTGLQDDEAAKRFFDRAAGSVQSEGNTLILLAAETYDVPVKRRDEGGDGSSDSMYSYILSAVCPVKEAKSTLTYDPAEKDFRVRSCDWNVGAPERGFLFPAFDNRQTNIYNALYYTKDPGDSGEGFLGAVFGVEPPVPADEQKEKFETMLAETLENECSIEVVHALHDEFAERIDEHKKTRDPEPLVVTKRDVVNVLESCGVSEEKLEAFGKSFDEEYGAGADLAPINLIEPKKFEIKTPDTTVKVNPDRGDLVETRVIDGVKYLLIRADEDVTVNGVAISIK